MKYLISCCAALIVAISGTNLVYAEDADDDLGSHASAAVQHRVAEEGYFSGSGFESQVESYAQGGDVPSASEEYLFFDASGHDFSKEEYLYFSGRGFNSHDEDE